MYTHCPECSTYFRITAEQLRAAQGKVRCSNCDTVFNALETLEETLPAGQVTANEDSPSAKPQKAKAKKPPRPKKPRNPGGLWRLIKTVVGLVFFIVLFVALLGQATYYRRNQLAQKFPVLRPQLEMGCNYVKQYAHQYVPQINIPCEIAMRRDLSKLQLDHKDIRLHPKLNHALLINANLVNQASFAQPYPIILLTFTDNQNHVVARGVFKPSEYLSDPEMAKAGLGPHESALLVLEVVDPGPTAVNYTFDFK